MGNQKILFIGTLERDGKQISPDEKESLFDTIITAIENAGYSFNQHSFFVDEEVEDAEAIKKEIETIW